MKNTFIRDASRIWSLGWVVLIRTILYLVVTGFLLQYIYFGETGRVYRPNQAILLLVATFLINLFILYLGLESKYRNHYVALSYVLDMAVMTRIVLVSGGFSSIFIPYYLPILIMATAWLPRKYTAVFPSMASLGAAYLGTAHLIISLGEIGILPFLFPREALYLLRYSPAHAIVTNMLILAVLFFIISYLSGIISDKLFLEQRLNAEVLTSMREGVAVVTSRKQLSFANMEFFRIFPEAEKDFLSVADELLAPEESGITLDDLLEQQFPNSLIITRENALRRDRPPLEVRVSGIAVRGGREVFGLVFIITDMSLRRRVEEAEKNLARFSAISTMAAGLAHEIRNPLASLRSAVQEIGEAFPPDSQNRLLTNVVLTESDRLDRIIGRFLDFSREGELRLSRRRLGPVLENLRTILAHDTAAEGMEMVVSLRDDPEVLCDLDRIMEIFLNLSLNAAHIVPHPGGRLEIVLQNAFKGATPGVEVLFLDNGPGVREEAMEHIFEPFFTNREGGTGMGLPLSRKQAAMHGGDITVSNRPGGGACFRLWLPLEAVTGESLRRRRISYTEIIRLDQVPQKT